MAHRFVALRKDGKKTFLHDEAGRKVREIIWGDYLTVKRALDDGRLEIDWAARSPDKRRTLYIAAEDTVERRPLEIVFVDVGQGDGAVLISPERGKDERIIVIDAGKEGNMRAFLNARFKSYRGFNFHAAVVTHPDNDHYLGFQALFSDPEVGFKTVYHNGLVERAEEGEWAKLGGEPVLDPATGVSYLTALAIDKADVQRLFGALQEENLSQFPKLMHAALQNPKIGTVRMLSTEHAKLEGGVAWMPDFAPSNQRGYTIRVLGPVVEKGPGGKPALRRLKSPGETMNGHSVLLRLQYGQFSVLFGGDLNEPAEKFLLQHYTGRATFPKPGTPDHDAMVAEAQKTFRSEVMKSCHHGSEKVTDAFLAAVNPAAFIISSGDQEGHVHPRPDLLGRLGRYGRGDAPVILSTELQRSSRPLEDGAKVQKLLKRIDALATALSLKALGAIKRDVEKLARSNVEVYGAIYLKTDGERLMTPFRIESRSDLKKWFSFRYAFNAQGELVRTD